LVCLKIFFLLAFDAGAFVDLGIFLFSFSDVSAVTVFYASHPG
jgi:hypothetical protein